jgi:ribosomal protein S18 acetylase RimI-like enzyme
MNVRPVAPPDEAGLADLFASLDATHFHPHDLGPEGAAAIAGYTGRDVYLVLGDERLVAYGMLRGWDEGYSVPSLGIAVRQDCYGRGYGRAMMVALHEAARDRGATKIRLRVHPENGRARSLYERLGYVDVGEERGERVMVLDLLRPDVVEDHVGVRAQRTRRVVLRGLDKQQREG